MENPHLLDQDEHRGPSKDLGASSGRFSSAS